MTAIGEPFTGLQNRLPPHGKQARHVTHFAAGAGRILAIQVQAGPRLTGDPIPLAGVVTNQVAHLGIRMTRGIAQRPAADMLLELADGVQRPVTGIMHAGCKFIHRQQNGSQVLT